MIKPSQCMSVKDLKEAIKNLPENMPVSLISIEQRFGIECIVINSKTPFLRLYELGSLKHFQEDNLSEK